ncbi:MAG TPA: EAL domain-containing protein [Baekduia sp.]|nr:EAL domain-containing protein [Baekduia sp.]
MSLRAAARTALDRPGVLRAHFQPIVDLARGVVVGYEALARFNGPPDASPDRWFAAAHEGGFGPQLEARALSVALAAHDGLPANTFLTVNLGPAALLSAPVRAVLDGRRDLRGVIVEVTEQQPVHDYGALAAALAPARERGAMVAVDDAGAGFASLQHIAQLRPDLVKVDRSLVAGVDGDPVRRAVLEAMGLFTSRMDAWLLAEGVETAAELEALLALGIPLAQGWFLGRPQPGLGPASEESVALCRAAGTRGVRFGWLGELVLPATALPAGASDAELARARLEQTPGRHVVCVDEHDRPVALVRASGRTPVRRPVLAVTPGDELGPTAMRALARDEGDRYDPIALCDERGRLVGVIPVERLFARLADGDGASRRAA